MGFVWCFAQYFLKHEFGYVPHKAEVSVAVTAKIDFLDNLFIAESKKGFGVPIAKWINKDLKTIICDTLLSDDLIKLNYFNNDYIKKIIDNHWNKKNNNRKEIWTIYCFAVWNSKNN